MEKGLQHSVQMLVIVGILMIVVFAWMYWTQLRREVNGIRVYNKEPLNWFNLALVLGAAFIVKLFIAASYDGHGTDMTCFSAWSDMIFNDGPWGFYHSDAFTDYPPGYMSLLWIVGALRKMFGLDVATASGKIVIKLFPILFDMGAGVLLYKIAKKKFSEWSSLLLSLTYVINPIVVLDSSAWGQVDGVFTFFVLLVGYLCMEEKRIPAYFAFVAGVLIKPQMVVFTPILIWTIIQQVFLKDYNTKKMLRDLIGGLSAIVAMVVFTLPFGVDKVFTQYVNTLGSYPYCTINAYNFWGLLGENWQTQTHTFLGIQANTWGTLSILVSVALSAFIFFRLKEDKSRYFLSMAVLIANMFLFSVRMHERYLFPVIVLILAAFLVKPTKEIFATYVGFSFVHFLNVGHVLWAYIEENGNTAPNGPMIGVTAVLTLLLFAYFFVAAFSTSSLEDLQPSTSKKRGALNFVQKKTETKEQRKWTKYVLHIHTSKKMPKFTKWDWIVLGGILVIYSIFAFYDLGDMQAPESNWSATAENNSITLNLGETKDIGMIYTYLGVKENRTFTLEMSKDGQNYDNKGTVRATSVFCWDPMKTWKEESQEEGPDKYEWDEKYQYIRLTASNDLQNEMSVLNEIVVVDKDGNPMEPVNKGDYPTLFDEQQCFEPQEDAPQTACTIPEEGTTITLDLGGDHYFSLLRGYSKSKSNQRFKIEIAKSVEDESQIAYTDAGVVVSGEGDGWSVLNQEGRISDAYTFAQDTYRYIRLTTLQPDTQLDELVLTDSTGHVVKIEDYEGDDALFDEQDGYNKAITFRSGTYFDEIYHAKTAYEMIHGISNYEWTHPPLGKWFIGLGIRAFGMNPFGWRVVGVLFGIAMLPFMYLFARRLFAAKIWAAGGLTFLFAFDFMHFTQTRISTIDVYGTFFIIAMFFFMYQYSQTSFYDSKLWKTFIPLGLSALMMGLGCASKWTAVYASAGLGVFFFAIIAWRYYEYRLAKKDPKGTTGGISHQHIIEVFRRNTLLTLLFCILFFVIIAGTIYLCSYIPFEDNASVSGGGNAARFMGTDWDETPLAGFVQMLRDNTGDGFWELVGKMLNNQSAMYSYHHDLEATHPFSSTWYEWPTMIRPMYYFSATLSNGLKEGISAFGNPLVWWAGIPALLFITCPFSGKRRLNEKLGGFAAQWGQWLACISGMFLALYALVLRQTKYVDTSEVDLFSQWGWYGIPFIILGIVAFGYLCIQLFSRGERVAVFVIFAYAVQYLPWVLVPRCTFAYHYFPSVPFIAMMVIYSMVKIVEYNKKWLKWCIAYLVIAFLLFLLFYPVLSGQAIIDGFARDGLRWLENWQLIS